MKEELKKQFIYILKDPISNEIKYVGKSNNPEKRLKRHMSEYNLIESWTAKNKWLLYLKNKDMYPIIEIIQECFDDDVNFMEIKWISHYKSIGIGLLNETEGGDGYNWIGRKLSKEHVEKMKYNHPLRKEIVQFDLDNNIIDKFDSLHEMNLKTGFDRRHVSKCCKGLKSSITIGKNYYFRFLDDYFPCKKSNIVPDIDNINKTLKILSNESKKFLTKRQEINLKIKNSLKLKRKSIIQYNLYGKIINEFESLTEASKITGFHIYLISNCCKKKGSYTVGGGKFWRDNNISDNNTPYTFRYKNDVFDYTTYNKNIQINSKKVCKYDLDGSFIETFNSIKEASRSAPCESENINSCCKRKINKKTGKFIVVKGFTYRYFTETNGENL